MSLFICSECQCVDNTNCCTIGLDKFEDFPNLSKMDMYGFDEEYDKTGVRSERRFLCSECNTGEWHGEFSKEKATEVEIEMGRQLKGDEHNIFTFHPLWRIYSKDPDNFNMKLLEDYVFDTKTYQIRNSMEEAFKGMFTGACEPFIRKDPKVGRNDKCPCGSGRKYKKCCLTREE